MGNIQLGLLTLFLPEGILDYFDIAKFEKHDRTLTIFLNEKEIVPEEYNNRDPKARGFTEARAIEDFPIRRMLVQLRVKRRRWSIDGTDKKVTRDWDLVAKGTRMTSEFATFLKGITR